MNQSWHGTPKSSPGFVYFNPSPSNGNNQNQSDSPDFLSLGDSPQPNRFSPNCYSSPRGRYCRGGARDYPPNNRRFSRGSGGRNKSFNSSSSFNKSHNTSWKDEEGTDISKFLHHSFVEDPWAELEAKLKNESHMETSCLNAETDNT